MEWSVLFTLGHRIRQNPYSYHRFRLGASTYSLARFFLRPELIDLGIPSRRLHVFPKLKGRTRFRRHLCCACQLLRRCHGAPHADIDTNCVCCHSPGYITCARHLSPVFVAC